MGVSVCCLNVRGVRQTEKRRDVFHYIRRLGCAMYCIVDTHFTPDMEVMVRSEWGGDVFLSCGTFNSRGVAVLLNPSAAVIVHHAELDDHGNYVILDVEFDGLFRCNYVVLYGPNDDRPDFFEELFAKVCIDKGQPVILVGDWNLVIDPQMDTKFYGNVGNPRARNVVINALENESLIDVWREQHPNTSRFTWKRTNPAKFSRLDYFLVSADLFKNITGTDIVSGYRTDHSVVTLTLEKPVTYNRKLFWKFNNSLLRDKRYIGKIKEEIRYIKELYALPVYSTAAIDSFKDIAFSINDQLFFETLLCHLRGVTVQYSAYKKKASDKEEKMLIERIQELDRLSSDDTNVTEELERLREELLLKRKDRMTGVLVRARSRWIEEGERPTRYFCGLEKHQYLL